MTPVQTAVTAHFNITLAALRGTLRNQRIICARHVAFYLERELEGRTFAAIGDLYDRDHTSVLAAYRHVAERLVANDDRYVDTVAAVSFAVKTALDEKRRQRTQAEGVHTIDALACPTCGAPVVKELQRQIAMLTERLNGMGARP